MSKEIERKYIIDSTKLTNIKKTIEIKQGYIETKDNTVVRIRITDDKSLLTIKGENVGMTRSEFEYEIPTEDGIEMFNTLCSSKKIEKTRHLIDYKGKTWEVDIFNNIFSEVLVLQGGD